MDVQLVGKQFVRVYYKTLFHDPMNILSLYKNESSCTRHNGSEQVSHCGLEEIGQALKNIQPNCLLDVRNVVVQSSFADSLIITVTGLVSDSLGESQRPFTQVFVLHPQKPKGLFVLNEVFLYTDDSTGPDPLLQSADPPADDKGAESEQASSQEAVAASKGDAAPTGGKENRPKDAEKKSNKKAPREGKKQKQQKPKQAAEDKKAKPEAAEKSQDSTNQDTNDTGNATPKAPSTWASIAKKSVPESANDATPAPKPASKPAPKKATPAPKANVPKPVDSRFLEVRNFDSAAKADTLKSAFVQFGEVTYVRFLGATRAVIEFTETKSVQSALSKNGSVTVGGKVVQLSAGNPQKQNARRGNHPRRGSANGRDGPSRSNRGGKDTRQ